MCWELPNQLCAGLPPGNSSGWGGRFKNSFYTRNEAADMPSVIQYGTPDKLNNTLPREFAWLSALHWLVRQSTNSQQLFHTTANLRPASNHSNCKLPMESELSVCELSRKGFLEKRCWMRKAFEKSNLSSPWGCDCWVCVRERVREIEKDGGTLSWMSRGHFFSCKNLKVPTWPCRAA